MDERVIPLFKVAMADDAEKLVGNVLRSGYIGQGPVVEEFEAALRHRVGNPDLVTVNSGTSGLHLALYMLATDATRTGGRARTQVLTTPLTCTATNWPILSNALAITWVDVDAATLNVDLEDVARKISEDTLAIMIVHWAGYPVDLDRLARILDDAEATYGFRPTVIEDCAHAWGSTYVGRPLGNHGNICVYSFQAIKHLTSGDGGLVVFPTAKQAERARRLRWYGIDRTRGDSFRCEHDIPETGFKFHMNDINAAIGLANLGTVGSRVERHVENAAYFDEHLAEVPGLAITERAPDRQSSFWIYSVLVERRSDFIARLAERGVAASQVHQRNDVHSAVCGLRSPLPGVDIAHDRMVSIPVGWWVDQKDRDRIVAAVRSGW
jgi:dTDP-4-amino-4,6-dideoxy-D-glucose/dTDP-4-amino-2,4-dideoxy-beta-L-xylose transaminase